MSARGYTNRRPPGSSVPVIFPARRHMLTVGTLTSHRAATSAAV